MTIEGWATLWLALFWLSAGAFGLVTLFVAVGYVRQLFGKP